MLLLSWSWSPVVGHIVADAAALLAHQGGWDEMLMVAVPVAAFAGMLYAANRRAGRLAEPPEHDTVDHESPGPSGPSGPRADPLSRTPRDEPRNERGGPV